MSGAAQALGATGSLMGLAASGFAIVALVTRPVTSPMADLLNKKKQYISAVLIYVLCYLGYSISHSVAVLIAFRCVHGFALGMIVTTGATLSSLYIPQSQIPRGMGVFAMIEVASMAVGPYLGLWIAQSMGYSACFAAAAGMSALGLSLTFLIRDVDGKTAKGKVLELVKKPRLDQFVCFDCLAPVGTIAMFAVVFGCVNSFLALAAAQRGVGNIGAFFTVYSLTTMLVRPVVEMLGKRFGQSSLIVPCGLISIAGLIVCANASGLPMYLITAVLLGIGNGSVGVVLLIICTQRVDVARRGLATGTYYLGMDIGFGIGPVIGGAIADAFGYGAMMYALIVPVALAMVIGVLGRKGMVPLMQTP
jgi:MFS family permease